MKNQDLTYRKLIDYLGRTTKPLEKIEYKNPWDCRNCLPSYENYHCLFYIIVNIKTKYAEEIEFKNNPEALKRIKGYENKCNACKYIPANLKAYEEFLIEPITEINNINNLFHHRLNAELKTWICKAFGLDKELGLDRGNKLCKKSWKLNGDGDDVKSTYFTEKFWKEKLQG